MIKKYSVLILISAFAEWREVEAYYPLAQVITTPYGRGLEVDVNGVRVIFVHGGWGKISAAATTQYALDMFQPDLVVNLGTCGGIGGRVQRGDIILASETLVYDVIERMGDFQAAVDFYTTHLNSDWLVQPYPQSVQVARLISADQDIDPARVAELSEQYDAIACDWESGAIAWVCAHHSVRCLILRGVTDVVSPEGGEAYNQIEVFHSATHDVMENLLDHLPAWLACAGYQLQV